jgi:hypothetical protein
MSIAQFLTLLVFITINFLVLFNIRTRTTIIISLIIANLIAVLFFSISITNHASLKEIILALIIYSMVVLFLISNYNPLPSNIDKPAKIKLLQLKNLLMIPIVIAALAMFCTLFFLTNNLTKIADNIHDEKLIAQSEAVTKPAIENSNPEINEKKRARLKDKLSGNFLLKRSSDMILLIVAVSAGLLLLAQRNLKKDL